MLTRYSGMSAKQQSYLFTLGLAITLLGMVLTQMWLPIVVGAFILTALCVEAWIRVAHVQPMHEEIRKLKKQVAELQKQVHRIDFDE